MSNTDFNTKSSTESSTKFNTELRTKFNTIIAAMVKYETIQEAAKAAGTTTAAIRELMENSEFRNAYIKAKTEAIRKHAGARIETPEKWIY